MLSSFCTGLAKVTGKLKSVEASQFLYTVSSRLISYKIVSYPLFSHQHCFLRFCHIYVCFIADICTNKARSLTSTGRCIWKAVNDTKIQESHRDVLQELHAASSLIRFWLFANGVGQFTNNVETHHPYKHQLFHER